jgi:hypothetical protein
MTKTIQTRVLQRFMAPEEFKKFIVTYRQNTNHGNRFSSVSKLITDNEKEFLTDYFVKKIDTPTLCSTYKMKPALMATRVRLLCMRMVYQNLKELGI